MDENFFNSSPFIQATGMAKQATSRKMVRNILEQSVGNESKLRKSSIGNKLKSNTTEFSMMGNSSLFNESGNFQLDATRQLLEPSTPTSYKQNIFNSINCLPENEAGIFATSNLFFDFNQRILENSTVQSAHELLASYEDCCSNEEQFLMQMKYKTSSDVQFESINSMCGLLVNELRTWRLLSCLYQDKMQEDALNASKESAEDDSDVINENEQRVIDLWFKENSDIRRAQSVVDWLEKNAASEINMNEEKIRFFHDNVSWENTLHFLKQNKLKATSDNAELIVSEMDPDAPERQKRNLINLDKNDEILLLKHVFAFIRAGKVKEAQEMCIACGQSWRAATLEGWKLYGDPNMMSRKENDIESIMGNPMRDLWKKTAWHMSMDESLSGHERAIYGTFSGNLKSMLNVCLSWEDYIWAYFKALVDISVEKEVQNSTILRKKSITQAGGKADLPNALWDQFNSLNTPEKIFDTMQASSNDVIEQESKELFHLIQKFIILEDTNSIIETAVMWVNPTTNDEECGQAKPQVLRFLVHLILFFENLGVDLNDDKSSCIIESYVNFLASNESTQQLVAFYTAALKPEKQVAVYSDFLKKIKGKRAQEEFLELAYNVGLNVPSITKRVVEEIREEGIHVEYSLTFLTTAATNGEATAEDVLPAMDMDTEILPLPAMDTEILPDDQRLIDAIDWLVYDASQRADAVKQCCTMMRSFLISSKFSAVREVFNKIPEDSIDIIYREFEAKGSEYVPDNVKNSIREYLCMKAYISAHQTFKEWFAHFFNKKPGHDEDDEHDFKKVKKMKTFSKKIIKKQRRQSYVEKLEEWQNTLDQFCNNVRDHIYNVLLFPEGGWLVDAVKVNGDEKRDYELEVLRKMCVPTLCDLLLTAMEKTGNRTDECIGLCNVLTSSENDDLTKLFAKNVGRKLLKRIKDIAMNDLS